MMKNSHKLLTKVAKGIAYGDVSNASVRNILTEISKRIAGNFTEQEMYDTLDFFDWRCPYTGKDLRPLIENNLGGYVTDHVYPQNKDWCGLNVKGNLLIVDNDANSKKHNQDVETFLLTDTSVLRDLDEIGQTRQERLDKIKEFQKICGYDPERIRKIVSPIMEARYNEIRSEQEHCIANALNAMEMIGLCAIALPSDTKTTTSKKSSTRATTELNFSIADETQFKEELLKSKKAHFVLTYSSGAVKTSPWNVERLDVTSNLRANIQSRPFWRNRITEGLVKVEVFID